MNHQLRNLRYLAKTSKLTGSQYSKEIVLPTTVLQLFTKVPMMSAPASPKPKANKEPNLMMVFSKMTVSKTSFLRLPHSLDISCGVEGRGLYGKDMERTQQYRNGLTLVRPKGMNMNIEAFWCFLAFERWHWTVEVPKEHFVDQSGCYKLPLEKTLVLSSRSNYLHPHLVCSATSACWWLMANGFSSIKTWPTDFSHPAAPSKCDSKVCVSASATSPGAHKNWQETVQLWKFRHLWVADHGIILLESGNWRALLWLHICVLPPTETGKCCTNGLWVSDNSQVQEEGVQVAKHWKHDF